MESSCKTRPAGGVDANVTSCGIRVKGQPVTRNPQQIVNGK